MDGREAVPPTVQADVAVVGGGVVGLGIAWEAARSGRSVVVVDPAPGTGASFAAAGMLAAVSEYHYQEEDLLGLTLESARLWPGFAGSLGAETGYQSTPTLCVAGDAADRQALADLRAVQEAHGLGVRALTVREARSLEPMLAPAIAGAFEISADHQVDPRRLVAAILGRLGEDRIVRRRAQALVWAGGAGDARVVGVLLDDGREVRAGETIVANAIGARDLAGLPVPLPLRPVYGDILRLRVPESLRPLVTATVRGLVRGKPVYLVPREDGTLVIGATQREDGSDAVSAGGVYELLRDAQALVPAVAELELYETTARARPGTPDNAPLLGRVAAGFGPAGAADDGGHVPGLIVATGFFRHGVLLTPAAARICVELLDGRTEERWDAFRPDRFARIPHETHASYGRTA
ncbi:glycine oxidase ThiO [Sinomonas sp. ASV322]|uniref:glycine oxidase ThiO n=1 Tax=Sinomonas sp. ASV322 TaxID=3041920 RepID=UPI0027DCC84D|nr:glycine oxidase ThiO [Sinomonas sp. ASV322]MDQ4503335.1 glycine oxidase ThiO [Sinomonas sp. ASV322]